MDKTLPHVCAAMKPVTEELIFIRKGDSAYYPPAMVGILDETLTADKWNAAHDISSGEMAAMIGGAIFGWDAPSAYAKNYHADGRPNSNLVFDD